MFTSPRPHARRGKLLAALRGVALAAALLWLQGGLFAASLSTSCAIITRIGDDMWVMARGTEVVDNGETLYAGSRSVLASPPRPASQASAAP